MPGLSAWAVRRPVIALIAWFGCGDPAQAPKALRVGFVPAEDAAAVMQNAQPVVEILRRERAPERLPAETYDVVGPDALTGDALAER